jgi:hypothetical protein
VAREAAEVLQSMGEKIAPAVQNLSVRFRVSVNGKPLASGSRIDWSVGSISSSAEVDDDGTIGIRRDDFSDSQRKATSVQLASSRMETADKPIFRVEFPAPADLDSIIRVDVDVSPLELILRDVPGSEIANDRKASLQLRRHPDKNSGTDEIAIHFNSLERKFDVLIGQPVTLWMQTGKYDVAATAPKAARFTKQITVSAHTSPLEIQLQPGADLRYELIRPDGERRAPVALLKDGINMPEEYYDYKTRRFRGLPTGNYLLHIPASSVVESDSGDFLGYVPAKIAYAARDVSFVITADSPPLIDLGKIILETAPK